MLLKWVKTPPKDKRNYAFHMPSLCQVLVLPQLVPQYPRTDSTLSLGYHAGKTGKKIIFTFTSWGVLTIMLRSLD